MFPNFIVWINYRTFWLCRTTAELVEAKKKAAAYSWKKGKYAVFVLTGEFDT